MEKPKIVYVTHINTTPEKLWAALTEPEFTRQFWNGRRIQSDWTVGASVKTLRPDGGIELSGEVLQADPPRLLSYTILRQTPAGAPPEKRTRVTFEIAMAFGVAKLTLTHDEFDPDSGRSLEVFQGWPAIISSLKSLLETGNALPFKWNW